MLSKLITIYTFPAQQSLSLTGTTTALRCRVRHLPKPPQLIEYYANHDRCLHRIWIIHTLFLFLPARARHLSAQHTHAENAKTTRTPSQDHDLRQKRVLSSAMADRQKPCAIVLFARSSDRIAECGQQIFVTFSLTPFSDQRFQCVCVFVYVQANRDPRAFVVVTHNELGAHDRCGRWLYCSPRTNTIALTNTHVRAVFKKQSQNNIKTRFSSIYWI